MKQVSSVKHYEGSLMAWQWSTGQNYSTVSGSVVVVCGLLAVVGECS